MKKIIAPLLLLSIISVPQPSRAETVYATYDECLLETLKTSSGLMTVDDIKLKCRSFMEQENSQSPENCDIAESNQEIDKMSAVSRRVSYEGRNIGNLFTILPHKQNYILMASYNDHPHGDDLQLDDSTIDHTEIKFQLSFKIPLTGRLFANESGRLFAAYSMKSFWQAYNHDISSPFRETNHEPEIFLSLRSGKELLGWKNSYILTGFSHQSNGRSGYLSRSWNRIYLDFIFEKDNFALSFKPWYRIPENNKSYVGDPIGDDNPGISRYMGYGELTGAWTGGGHTLSAMLRNNVRRHDNRGSIELGWSFPLGRTKPLRGYIQYFNGYGESMIDYDTSSNRFGFGLLLTDWL